MVLVATPAEINRGATQGYAVEVIPELVGDELIYVARHPELPRCFSQGFTPEEAIANLDEVREMYVADMRAAGIPVPAPVENPPTSVLELALTQPEEYEDLLITWEQPQPPAK